MNSKAQVNIQLIAVVIAIISGITIAMFIISGTSKQLGGEPDYIADMAQKIYEGDLDIEFKETKISCPATKIFPL